jgi:dihydrodipicolinate synthase/N-acetylneuraminate lyase
MLFGRDEILLSALALGARGAVGSTYNPIAPIYQRLMAALDAGDLVAARREQARARECVELPSVLGGLPAGKAVSPSSPSPTPSAPAGGRSRRSARAAPGIAPPAR